MSHMQLRRQALFVTHSVQSSLTVDNEAKGSKMNDAEKLVCQLRAARDAYYNHDPAMSDAAFDVLEDELRSIDPTHAYFSEVGAPVNGSWPKAKHLLPMGSLDKVQSSTEMHAWCASATPAGAKIVVTDKLDGASIELVYRDGRLQRAVTRGDGITGDDITRNVKLMKGVPDAVPGFTFTGQVRGEVVCLKPDFEEWFKGEGYSNARNTANGIMKRQDDPELCRRLTVVCYELVPSDGIMPSKVGELERLIELGFCVPTWYLCDEASEVEHVYNAYIDKARAQLVYDIDGLVLYVDDTRARHALGERNMRPKGAVAFKFPHEQKQTILRRVDWQVGPSGRITPVAFFDPIELTGAHVKQASLHNPSYIKKLGDDCSYAVNAALAVGATIMVSRRNDVIPYVEELVGLPSEAEAIAVPLACPSCLSPTSQNGEYLVCTNPVCPAQVSGAIKRWVQKLDVKDFGDTLIDALCASGMVRTVADLYSLDIERVAKLTFESGRVCGLTTARLALKNLDAKRELPIDVLVGSMGIPLWGRSMVKLLVEAGFDSLDKLRNAKLERLSDVPGVGPTRALAFVNGVSACWNVLMDLLAAGVTVAKPPTGRLKGTTMCMTGFRDGALVAAFEAAGGSVKGSVGRGLTYLVAIDPSVESGKLDKARRLGTSVVSRDDMWAIIKGA